MKNSSPTNQMTSVEIREKFFSYFMRHGHRQVASSNLIPENDATLLFANAGMNQFKNLFLGLEQRDYKRAVTSQKCVRAGGKHNDLENVGHTARHHTFFEMLGNFSFGDYFKKDAIHMAWDLLTRELEIPKDRLYVTVFLDDDEAAEIWHKQEGVAKDRIYRFGEKDNFWRMGDVGPCGPCSEIFYDHGPDADDPFNPSSMGGDGDRYVEIWNNVFMQFNEDGTGRTPLPRPSVDTGAGLERWAAVMQGTHNNFNTDLFLPIIEKTASIAKIDFRKLLELEKQARQTRDAMIKGIPRAQVIGELAALRVVADHARATVMLIADGVLPANEGRGYVLRRIMRRAIRYARNLTDNPAVFTLTVQKVIDEMGAIFPEVLRSRETIVNYVNDEVARFLTTLDQGTEILNGELEKIANRGLKTVSGEVVFKLYDTFGFPADLTRIMAEEKGYQIDEDGFTTQMEGARQKAKSASKFKALSTDAAHLLKIAQEVLHANGKTEFVGYGTLEASGNVLLLSDGGAVRDQLRAGEQGLLITDRTAFYAEGGGQVGDHGVVTAAAKATDGTSANGRAEVFDCTKTNDVYLHHVRVIEGVLSKNATVTLQVTESKRRATAANHSATHLVHAALRQVLGSHVSQAGSSVDSERLRFDYTHSKPLQDDDISRIEDLVNQEIAKQIEVNTAEMPHQAALQAGALALFGEKYGDLVRVVKMGEFSTELCGGTHVTNTAMIRLFKVVSDTGVSAGVRRLEALTGEAALRFMLRNTNENQTARRAAGFQDNWAAYLHGEATAQGSTVTDWIEQAKQTIKVLQRDLQSAKGASIDLNTLVSEAKSFTRAGIEGKLVTALIEMDDRQVLSDLADRIKDKIHSGVVVLVGRGDGKHPIVVSVTKDLTAQLSAGKVLGEVARELKGKGGGRADFAQGAGEDLSRLREAFAKAAVAVDAFDS